VTARLSMEKRQLTCSVLKYRLTRVGVGRPTERRCGLHREHGDLEDKLPKGRRATLQGSQRGCFQIDPPPRDPDPLVTKQGDSILLVFKRLLTTE